MEVGAICVKTAGRDASRTCVIVKKLADNMVLIDGQTRRRKCNVAHLELLHKTLEIAEDAPTAEIASAFKKMGIEVTERKSKPVKTRPRKQKAKKTPLETKKVTK